MNENRPVGLADTLVETLDNTVILLVNDLGTENRKYTDQLILATNDDINNKVLLLRETTVPTEDVNF